MARFARALFVGPLCFRHPAPPTVTPANIQPASAPKQTPRKRGPSCVRFSSLLASVTLAVRGGVLRRATPSCPFVLPVLFNMPVCLRLWLSPLACAFGVGACPFRGPRSGGAWLRPALAPLRSVRLRPPLCSVRPPPPNSTTTIAGLRACGASAIGASPLKGGRPRSPFAPLVRPFGALRVPCLFGFRLLCRAGLRAVCRAGCLAGVSNGALRLTDTPARLARERDFALTLPYPYPNAT